MTRRVRTFSERLRWLVVIPTLCSPWLLGGCASAPTPDVVTEAPPPAPTPAPMTMDTIIAEASQRFNVPEPWIRAVMAQESGGRTHINGQPIVSKKGAMGLMQVMPSTWATLRDTYKLGSDPFEPHDNVMAGTAYIREMFDQYGAPGFLAAYNAGPGRYETHLKTHRPLPGETRHYVAVIAPKINGVYPTGPAPARGAASSATQVAALPTPTPPAPPVPAPVAVAPVASAPTPAAAAATPAPVVIVAPAAAPIILASAPPGIAPEPLHSTTEPQHAALPSAPLALPRVPAAPSAPAPFAALVAPIQLAAAPDPVRAPESTSDANTPLTAHITLAPQLAEDDDGSMEPAPAAHAATSTSHPQAAQHGTVAASPSLRLGHTDSRTDSDRRLAAPAPTHADHRVGNLPPGWFVPVAFTR